ncbi:putative lipoprotein [Burkholderia cenocepacia]|uniref:Putative lipoprotein n=1 Tax=Burkholderia cenocepacia TaxID=95486 RepID=A0A6J5JW10_9BURK|nr:MULTISPECIES: PqiC family protein [Burkholderia cepacia complex]CAB3975719.1 putative lipoprotein [Burkholderia cenocepacia]
MKARSFHRLRMPLRITTCVALTVLSACTSPPVHFHTLAMTDSAGSDAVASPPSWLIDIQAVHVTAPADGNRFVVQSGPGRVDILEQERWAAPLGDELRDGLSTRVASRLGTIDVHRVAHAADAPVYRVTVNIQRIESWPASHVLLDATWSVSSGAGQPVLTCRSVIRAGASAGYDALVDAHRHALDMLALDIAAVIRAEATRAAPRAGCRTGTLDNNPG